MSAKLIEPTFRMQLPDRPTFRFRGGVWVSPSGQPLELVEFIEQLERDAAARPGVYPGSLTELAARARIARNTLSQMLHGHYTGRQAWKHVLPHLSVNALFYLKRCFAWNKHTEAALTALISEAYAAPTFAIQYVPYPGVDFGRVAVRT